jgi:predicted nucleotidyltransferase
MDIQIVKENGWLLFECISGSKAYNLNLPHSDTDIKGVYILPKSNFYGLEYVSQVNNESSDIVYYELKRFVELLLKNNPTLLEMLNVSPEHILYKHPLFELIKPELFLSKLCKDAFAGYAMTQIKKARGLNKKIMQPHAPERKNILHFCYIAEGQGSKSAKQWLAQKKWIQEKVGLVNIDHARDAYALFYDENGDLGFKGIYKGENSNEVLLSSIPKGLTPVSILFFNKDGYTKHCKDYKEYWDWVDKRNEERYQNTVEHGKNYDAKNMMHTFRLLDMAEEILSEEKVIVKRPNREELLKIRKGEFMYEDLIEKAEQKVQRIEELYKTSTLPEEPNIQEIEKILVEIREKWYKYVKI